ncbi:MAG: TrkH family potassium uptake protein [Clostridiales bacterium]|nr:TrkH family potassium uptake protein [Clostridiales bacterium]
MLIKMKKPKLAPTQVLVLGFAVLIIIGAILLNLPIASVNGASIGFLDAMFTSTSAVCVTGLVVVDTGTHWSAFGKTVILILIQIGGLGFMTMGTMIVMLLGKKISLKDRLVMKEALNRNELSGVVKLTRYILFGTFLIQSIGAILLSFKFIPEFGLGKGIAYSVFHAISAFCNAGFDIIGNGRSLMDYVDNIYVNVVVCLLIILGGLGFAVILDIVKIRKFKRFSLHSKIVVFVTALLLGAGFVVFLALEWSNPNTLGDLGYGSRFIAAFFQSVTTRTAGFNTISTGELTNASKLFTVILMFIGGSPASTAGGVKTVTVGAILFMVYSVLRGREETEIFGRRISRNLVNRAATIVAIGISIVLTMTMLLTITEYNQPFINILFESVSAFATVGLSTGLTPELTGVGRIIVMIMMFIGRLGPLTVAFALANKLRKSNGKIRYPEENILVG